MFGSIEQKPASRIPSSSTESQLMKSASSNTADSATTEANSEQTKSVSSESNGSSSVQGSPKLKKKTVVCKLAFKKNCFDLLLMRVDHVDVKRIACLLNATLQIDMQSANRSCMICSLENGNNTSAIRWPSIPSMAF